jgi:phosphate:Na+ symporter
MATLLPSLLGGIGLFLLGMGLLTEGAKGFAGESLRMALLRFTGAPWKAFLAGTLATLLLQSSSATTVTVIGFVSAGLLTFPQALGMVFGASLGTTGTGWLVAVFGLKIPLGLHALPVVALGAFLRLMGRGCWKPLGSAIAGFGLIFLGIDFLQSGMDGLRSRLPVASLPSTGVAAYLAGLGAGILMTLVLQSSSAAIAVTMTALHAGTINLEQSASMAVGAAIGTTVTALLASIGATNPAKRTAVAFVLFNLVTGILAILLLPVLLEVVRWESHQLDLNGGATALAAFHTTFIGLGVAVFLPLASPYAKWIEQLIPDHRPTLTRYLDKTLLQSPAVALEAVRRALRDTSLATMEAINGVVCDKKPEFDLEARRLEISQAITEIQRFLATIPQDSNPRLTPSRVNMMHVIDHLIRLEGRITPPTKP